MINRHSISITTEKTENLSLGYVKLYRSITKKAWYKKPEHVLLFVHLLLKASHSGYETWLNGKIKVLRPGQLVTGRKKLSDETGINESKIERILKCFEIEQQIEQQKTSTSRLITINNWATYQKSEQQFEQPVNNDRTTNEQPVNTIQEGLIKEKNGKECVSKPQTHILLKNKYSAEQQSLFNGYQRSVQQRKNVAQIEDQLTIEQFFSLVKKFPAPAGEKLFSLILDKMENVRGIQNRKNSVYKTMVDFIESEKVDTEIMRLRDDCKEKLGRRDRLAVASDMKNFDHSYV